MGFLCENGTECDGCGACLEQLESCGVRNIVDSGMCTKCMHDTFWSHRATHGNRGVQAGVIMLEG